MAIAELPHAELKEVSVNEIAFDQRQDGTTGQPSHDDPVAFRYGAWANPLGRAKWYLCKISFDVLRWAQGAIHRTEVAFLKAAIDEMVDGDGDPLPVLSCFMTRGINSTNDSDQREVFIVSRKGFIFKVPVTFAAGANIGGAGFPRRIALRSHANGKLVCADSQGDAPLIANREAAGPWETFEVIELP